VALPDTPLPPLPPLPTLAGLLLPDAAVQPAR
jgi:hypothetical protein